MKRVRKQMSEEMKVEREKEKEEQKERELQQLLQDTRTGGYSEGYSNGVRDGTVTMRNDAFADLADAWYQVQQVARATSIYAGIISNMYKRQTTHQKPEEK